MALGSIQEISNTTNIQVGAKRYEGQYLVGMRFAPGNPVRAGVGSRTIPPARANDAHSILTSAIIYQPMNKEG